MADKTLSQLTNSVVRICENSPKVQKDVELIRQCIVGGEGVLAETVMSLDQSVRKIQMRDMKNNLKSNVSHPQENKILGNTLRNIDKNIEKILNHVKDFNKGIRDIGKLRERNKDSEIVKYLKAIERNTRNLDKLKLEKDRRIKKDDERSLRNLKGKEIDNSFLKKDEKFKDLMRSLTIMEKMKNLSLKDLLFGKKKLKRLKRITNDTLEIADSFKDPKSVEKSLKIIDNIIDLIPKLNKIGIKSIFAKRGIKTIEHLLFGKTGKGGLVHTIEKLDKKRPILNKGRKAIGDLKHAVGSFLIMSTELTAVALLGPTALLGAAVSSGIVLILSGTFKLVSKLLPAFRKGAVAFALMGAGLLSMSVGFKSMIKATDGLTLKQAGIMAATIAGVGLATAGVGLLAMPIALGSASLLLIGGSLAILGVTLDAWRTFDSKSAIENVRTAVTGLSELFGLNLGGNAEKPTIGSIGGELINVAVSVLQFGKTFFVMGSLLMAGAALGMLKIGLKGWTNFNAKPAAENIKTAIGALKDAFGLEANNNKDIKSAAITAGCSILDMASALFQMGKTMLNMATITLATGLMDIIRVTLIPWENYDGKKSIANIKGAISGLKDAFGLKEHGKDGGNTGKNLWEKIKGFGGDILNFGSSLLQAGSTFTQMANISIGCGLMDVIRAALIPWNEYDGVKSISNIKNALAYLKSVFFAKDMISGNTDKFVGFTKDFENGMNHMRAGSKNADDVSASVRKLAKSFRLWDDSTVTNAENMSYGIDLIDRSFNKINGPEYILKAKTSMDLFKTISKSTIRPETSSTPLSKTINAINAVNVGKAGIMIDLFKSFAKIKDRKLFDNFDHAVDKFVDACKEIVESINNSTETLSGVTQVPVDSQDGTSETSPAPQATGVNVANTNQIAAAIAEALKNLSLRVNPSMIDVNLVAEGGSGKTIKLTLLD